LSAIGDLIPHALLLLRGKDPHPRP
jgi:hypothetical protein